jgi:hypothetical protein
VPTSKRISYLGPPDTNYILYLKYNMCSSNEGNISTIFYYIINIYMYIVYVCGDRLLIIITIIKILLLSCPLCYIVIANVFNKPRIVTPCPLTRKTLNVSSRVLVYIILLSGTIIL